MFDGLGSERAATNGSQTVTGTVVYEGFGQVVATTGSSSNPYMFAATSGYRNDGDSGLLHVGARYYDPQVGRFATRDTLLDQHPYLYCDHDPVNGLDPSGRYPTRRGWAIIGAVLVGTGTILIGGPFIPVGMVVLGGAIIAIATDNPKEPFDDGRGLPPPGHGPFDGQVYIPPFANPTNAVRLR